MHRAINTLMLKVGVLKQNEYCQPEKGAFYNAKLRNVPFIFYKHSLSISFLEERNLLLLMTSYTLYQSSEDWEWSTTLNANISDFWQFSKWRLRDKKENES